MIEHRYKVAGEEVVIRAVEHENDLLGFRDFIRANIGFLGLDTETTGLDTYSGDTLRVVQFGTSREAWIVPVERGGLYADDVRRALRGVKRFVLQNASFDLQVIEEHLGIPMEELWPKVGDTKILAHLVDPRASFKEGGIGHTLEELTAHYIDPVVAEEIKGSMAVIAREHKTTKAKIWKTVDYMHPGYQLYAGMDAILAVRLWEKLHPLVPDVSRKLIPYEHKLAAVCAYVERTGFLLDVDYSEQLSESMIGMREIAEETALRFGLDNVNSPIQVAEALMARGVKIKERTEGGQPKVDKVLLQEVMDGGFGTGAQTLATSISEAKKWGKWQKTWVQKFLDTRDKNDRCHAHINPLQARTARMSITGIPAQTLPSKGPDAASIRRCFLADEGHVIASVDYQAQELRVLAALSGDKTMIRAFQNNEDLHLLTAKAAFGDHITAENKAERGYAKVVNFGRVYGGGAKTVAAQTGLDFKTAKRVVDGFDAAYPDVKKLSNKLSRTAQQNGYIITPAGRRLPVDPSRSYSALNYLVQSTSRDVTARALIRLHEAGFTPYLRLPIHDEIVASVPSEKAEWGAEEIGRLMAETMGPVHVGTDPEVGGRSWGSLYGSDY